MLVVFVLVVVVMVVIVMELMSILVVHVVSVLLVVDWLVMSLNFVNHSGLVMSIGVMVLGVMVLGVVGQNFVLLSVSVMSSLVMRSVVTVVVVVGGLDLVDMLVHGVVSVMDMLVISGVAVVVVVGGLDLVDVLVHGVVVGESVMRDLVLHLSAEENLGEGETDGVTVLVEVLVLPLGLSVHDFVVNILSVHDKVVLNVEDEVPGVCEGLGHLAELVKISSDGSLALFELVGDVVNDVTEVLNSMEHSIE